MSLQHILNPDVGDEELHRNPVRSTSSQRSSYDHRARWTTGELRLYSSVLRTAGDEFLVNYLHCNTQLTASQFESETLQPDNYLKRIWGINGKERKKKLDAQGRQNY